MKVEDEIDVQGNMTVEGKVKSLDKYNDSICS